MKLWLECVPVSRGKAPPGIDDQRSSSSRTAPTRHPLAVGSDRTYPNGPGNARRKVRAADLKYNIFICIFMSSRNIAVQKVVYDGLVREKRADESFTAVLRRLLDQRRSVEDLSGAWGAAGAKADRARLQRLRGGGFSR